MHDASTFYQLNRFFPKFSYFRKPGLKSEVGSPKFFKECNYGP